MLGKKNYIDKTAVLIGDVQLGQAVSIFPNVVIRADVNCISIGDNTNIQDSSILHVTRKSPENPKGYPLIIKENVTIGHGVKLHGCTIENNVLLGIASIVLDNAVIEKNVIVGAGSLVPPNKILKSGYLYFGSPCKEIRKLTKEEIQAIEKSAQNYIKLKDDYLQGKFPHKNQ